jgi:hypothetical protein
MSPFAIGTPRKAEGLITEQQSVKQSLRTGASSEMVAGKVFAKKKKTLRREEGIHTLSGDYISRTLFLEENPPNPLFSTNRVLNKKLHSFGV